MNRFLRLVFIILIAGAAMNLSVVLWANVRSRDHQVLETERNEKQFLTVANTVSNHPRRADLVVESQQVDAYGKVRETTLLVGQYAGIGSDLAPLKIARVRIPGDVVVIDGMSLEFGDTFAQDATKYKNLRGLKLAYFVGVRGVAEKAGAAGSPGAVGAGGAASRPAVTTPDSFKFMERGAAPQLTRIEPNALRPSSYETFLWYYIWSLIPEITPSSQKAEKNGLEIEWMQSKPMVVQREHTYTAYIGAGSLELADNASPPFPRLLETMLAEGQLLEAEPAH